MLRITPFLVAFGLLLTTPVHAHLRMIKPPALGVAGHPAYKDSGEPAVDYLFSDPINAQYVAWP